MSVVDQVAKIDLHNPQKEAKSRLADALTILNNPSSSDSAKFSARLTQLLELVELERFADIIKLEPLLTGNRRNFVAYALYRLQNLPELRDFVVKSPSFCASLALAQAEYKCGNLNEAQTLLEQARDGAGDDDLEDIYVNLSAIAALKGGEMRTQPQNIYDFTYNKGCSLLTQGRFSDALKEFQKAISVAGEEEDRLSAIVQMGVAYFFQGDREAAQKQFEHAASHQESLPKSLRLVVRNNLAVLKYDGSMESAHEVLKAFDDFQRDADTLNSNQRVIIERNYVKLGARVGAQAVMKRAKEHNSAYPFDLEPVVTALTYTKSPKQIRSLASRGSEAAKIWVAATTNDQRYVDERVAELRMGSYGSILTALQEGPSAQSDEELAAYFRTLDDSVCLAGLTVLRSRNPEFDTEGIPEIGASQIAEACRDIDVEALMAQGISATSNTPPKLVAKRKRGGKKRYPKDYDPTRQPDPERWLAQEDRSRNHSKKAKTSQSTQGAASETAEVHTAGAASASQVMGAKKSKSKKKGRK